MFERDRAIEENLRSALNKILAKELDNVLRTAEMRSAKFPRKLVKARSSHTVCFIKRDEKQL